MNTQLGKKKSTGFKRTNNVDSERWDNSGFEELEKERKIERRPQNDPVKSGNQSIAFEDNRVKAVNDKWVHDKTQGEFNPKGFHGKNSRRPDRVLYKHPYKQAKQYSKSGNSDDLEEKSYAKGIEEKEPNPNINEDGISVISNASTNVSSEKIKLGSDEKLEERTERIQPELVKQENSTDSLSRDNNASPFFELSITFSEELTDELKIYENQDGLPNQLEEFCQNHNIPEETALYIKIFVLKQLSDSKYPDFDRYEDFYRSLLEENYNMLMSSHFKLQESEELVSPSTQKNF